MSSITDPPTALWYSMNSAALKFVPARASDNFELIRALRRGAGATRSAGTALFLGGIFMVIQILRERLRLVSCVVGVVLVAAIGSGMFYQAAAFSGTNEVADGGAVVLELFTSEGCSSCPPADALLSDLGSSTKGVIPLAYHVDYWNHLGWSDPFSSHQWSERQSEYAQAMNLDGEYTPQMVISGRWQCAGSDGGSIAHAVAAARSTSPQ